MTPAQLAEAQRLAWEWKPQPSEPRNALAGRLGLALEIIDVEVRKGFRAIASVLRFDCNSRAHATHIR